MCKNTNRKETNKQQKTNIMNTTNTAIKEEITLHSILIELSGSAYITGEMRKKANDAGIDDATLDTNFNLLDHCSGLSDVYSGFDLDEFIQEYPAKIYAYVDSIGTEYMPEHFEYNIELADFDAVTEAIEFRYNVNQ